jgi:hypothetical protein
MKLSASSRNTNRDLLEFDIWITPALGEITETEKFKTELRRVISIFEALGDATRNFGDEADCHPAAIARTFAHLVRSHSTDARAELFKSLASTLFLVTGKSDNNFKCQFPLYLRDVAKWPGLPVLSGRSARAPAGIRPLPRVIESEAFLELASTILDEEWESKLLEQFLSFLLQDEAAIRQFWTFGHCYFALKNFGRAYESNLLSPIVVFKVRGSVSASGGHHPEKILRDILRDWGLVAGRDFNLNDIKIGDGNETEKTRAFDFVLPYRTPGWSEGFNDRLLIQGQFYAGDSGSVSHKAVDQTRTSRVRAAQRFTGLRFVEFVDGAGYYSSLNGDLRRLFAMSDTHSFFQIRSIPIRLRRELQSLGFVTPLDVEHSIIRTDGRVSSVVGMLQSEGFAVEQVNLGIARAVSDGIVDRNGEILMLHENRRPIVRRYFLLDSIASNGRTIIPELAASLGAILVPGYGAFYGMNVDELGRLTQSLNTGLRDELGHTVTFTSDLRELANRGYVMMM